MHQNSISLAPAITGGSLGILGVSRQSIVLHENVLLSLSLILLLLSTIDPGPLGLIVTSGWLVSFVALCCINIGGALAVYISSLTIYSALHFEGLASVTQRPDNYAAIILFIAMLLLALNRHEGRAQLPVYLILAFLIFSILHVVLFSPIELAAIFRNFVMPLLVCVLTAMIGFRARELNALLNGTAILAGYLGLLSILEAAKASDWILPPWIGDPSLRPPDPWAEQWIGGYQSGGTLLYPAFNGLLLSLIFVMLFLLVQRGRSWLVTVAMLLCVAGSFLTYERGVWLSLALSVLWFPGWCCSLRQANMRRVALTFFVITLFVGAGSVVGQRLRDSDTILYRLALWGAGLRLFMAHPLLGIGFFKFGTAAASAEQGFGSRLPSYRNIADGAASHNTLLTVIVEFGIIGFMLYATVFFRIVHEAKSNASRLWGRSGGAWVLAFVIVYFVNAQFISAFEGTTNTVLFGILGVIAGARKEIFDRSPI